MKIKLLFNKLNNIKFNKKTYINLLIKYHLINNSLSFANNINYFINNDIKISSLFTKNEWSLLSVKYKILYNNNFNKLYKNLEWFPITGFLYNIGKISLLKNYNNLKYYKNIDKIFNQNKISIKKRFCGFEKSNINYGYGKLLNKLFKGSKISKDILYILTYHNLNKWIYPDENICRDYTVIANEYDWKMLPLLKIFNKCYTNRSTNVQNLNIYKKKLNFL